MASPLEIYREYQKRLRAHDFDHLSEVVDLEGYTETCLGLTPRWTVGFDVAWQNYQKNSLSAFSDMETSDEEVIDMARNSGGAAIAVWCAADEAAPVAISSATKRDDIFI